MHRGDFLSAHNLSFNYDEALSVGEAPSEISPNHHLSRCVRVKARRTAKLIWIHELSPYHKMFTHLFGYRKTLSCSARETFPFFAGSKFLSLEAARLPACVGAHRYLIKFFSGTQYWAALSFTRVFGSFFPCSLHSSFSSLIWRGGLLSAQFFFSCVQ